VPSRADQADKKTMGDAEQAAEACAALDAQLAELKAKYEQFFLGVDRTPPTKLHEVLKRGVGQLKATFLRQTAMKFRVQALAARLVTYERLWDRTLKEIEAGTYRRDVFKARLHLQARLKKPPSDPGPPRQRRLPHRRGPRRFGSRRRGRRRPPGRARPGAPEPGRTGGAQAACNARRARRDAGATALILGASPGA
jgi:hypothetical protein